LFRAGHDEAFRVIHERYRARLFAYTRQMLRGSGQDAEDAIQDIFVRAYSGLRADRREVALRAWLYRVAHNRCIDELRRPTPAAAEMLEEVCSTVHDPTVEAEQRDSLRRLLRDVQRLPEQQRSALLMRELGGVAYTDLASALDVSVPALKSLLVRARVSLAQSLEARNTECSRIREELIAAHDRGVRPNGLARRHMRDCHCCRSFRTELRGMSRQFAALIPALGPIAIVAKALGFGGVGGGAGGSAAAGSGAVTAGGAVGTGGAAASLGAIGAGHVATLLAAAVVTAAGAVEIHQTIVPAAHHTARHRAQMTTAGPGPASSATAPVSAAQVQNATAVATALPQDPAPAVRTPAVAKSVASPQAPAPRVATGTQTPPPTVTTPSSGGTSPSSGTTNSTPPPSTGGTTTGTTTTPTGIDVPPTTDPTGTLTGSGSNGPPSGTTTIPPGTTIPPSTGGGTSTTSSSPTGTSSDPSSTPPSPGSTGSGSGGTGSG
jgi:RNA polymerase sigma factor (sigma-70 family)